MTREGMVQVRRLRTVDALRARVAELGLGLAVDAAVDPDGPLAQPLDLGWGTAANRWCVLPMEGWDGTGDGRPTELVTRRWRRFGESGAGLLWGGEAVAVRADGRANPNQLVLSAATAADLARLRAEAVEAHAARFGRAAADRLVIGLQLTHSGRWARPHGAPQPLVAYRHPLLDGRVPGDVIRVVTDDELDDLVDAFVAAGVRARDAGFDFVDVKHCHGYLLHELLSARHRPGRYGGSLAGRSRFLLEVIDGLRRDAPGLGVGVRLSVFDGVPHRSGPAGVGEPEADPASYTSAFGLDEAIALVGTLVARDVRLVCVTAGSPYYVPHVQRPAWFPPSDGYLPPEDPLCGVARLLGAAAAVKEAVPEAVVVGSGYSYLQEWLAHVGQAELRAGRVDSVGIGRMVLSYHDLPADVLAGRPLDRRRICRTFSDCTTAPRNGLVSGCWPLDDFYKRRPDRPVLAAAKRAAGRAEGDDE